MHIGEHELGEVAKAVYWHHLNPKVSKHALSTSVAASQALHFRVSHRELVGLRFRQLRWNADYAREIIVRPPSNHNAARSHAERSAVSTCGEALAVAKGHRQHRSERGGSSGAPQLHRRKMPFPERHHHRLRLERRKTPPNSQHRPKTSPRSGRNRSLWLSPTSCRPMYGKTSSCSSFF